MAAVRFSAGSPVRIAERRGVEERGERGRGYRRACGRAPTRGRVHRVRAATTLLRDSVTALEAFSGRTAEGTFRLSAVWAGAVMRRWIEWRWGHGRCCVIETGNKADHERQAAGSKLTF